MFANLMRKSVTAQTPTAGGAGTPSSLQKRRQYLFKHHITPPGDAAAGLAASIRQIQQANSFLQFLKAMDVPIPTKEVFTSFLRQTVQNSMSKGYSKWALSQAAALALRLQEEPGVKVAEGSTASERWVGGKWTPEQNRKGGAQQRGQSRR